MKRIYPYLVLIFACILLLSACTASSSGNDIPEITISKQDNIPFTDNQSYAVAHLGYREMTSLRLYTEQYLDADQIPVHYFSDGDYYLAIPRYSGMALSLYRNDMTTGISTLVYEAPDCRPFIIQCNISDIFPDVTVRLTRGDETVEFSPFISLKDGTPVVGENGLDITVAH